MIQTATAAHTRYLSSPAEATLHGKIQGFVLRLPPQNKAHATFMQPLQCVLQHDVANPHASIRTWQHQMTTIMQPFQCDLQPQIQETHRITHTGTTTRCRTIQTATAAHTRYLSHRRLKPLYTEKYKVSCSGFLPKTKPMQHSCSHCRTQRRNRFNSKRSKPQPPHTRGTLHRRLKPLYTEECKVSCSGFLPKTKPMQHAAIAMRFEA